MSHDTRQVGIDQSINDDRWIAMINQRCLRTGVTSVRPGHDVKLHPH